MFSLITNILLEGWHILNESAIYVLFGFFMAALAKAFIPSDLLARHLGGDNFSSVIKASLFGVPLPLCSCGVIPAAIGLRKQGASKGSTTAFLISTPESGIDSMAITWALLDPIMTFARPLAAFITATVAGVLVNAMPGKKQVEAGFQPEALALSQESGSPVAVGPMNFAAGSEKASTPAAKSEKTAIPGGT